MSSNITAHNKYNNPAHLAGSIKMKKVIEALAAKFGACFDGPGLATISKQHLKLELGDGFMPLCIERVGRNLVSIAHYFEMNGDLVANPDIVFFTNPANPDRGWLPFEYTNPDDYAEVLTLSKGNRLVEQVLDQWRLDDLIGFADLWANNLRGQGWLDRAMDAHAQAKETQNQ